VKFLLHGKRAPNYSNYGAFSFVRSNVSDNTVKNDLYIRHKK
jgi:hypothetical protein